MPLREPAPALLRSRYPGITGCEVKVEPTPQGIFEAHIDLLLPQHQIIVNASHRDRDAALRGALELALLRLEETARRDPGLQ